MCIVQRLRRACVLADEHDARAVISPRVSVRIIHCDTVTFTRTKGASYAAFMRERVDVPVDMVKGRHVQFDVLVNDELVVSRKGGPIAKSTNKPWPEHDDVVSAVLAALDRIKPML